MSLKKYKKIYLKKILKKIYYLKFSFESLDLLNKRTFIQNIL